jgi:SAM-dependent methyltransferase
MDRTTDRFHIRQVWDRTHREQPASGQPEANLISFAEHLQSYLLPGAALLDAGCGRGRNSLYLSDVGFSVCACDISPVALGKARELTRSAGLTIHFQLADLIHLPYVDGSFAAAVCVHVLPYHTKADILKSVHELCRVLQPNGWLYVDLLDREDAAYGCGPKLEDHTFLDPDGMPIHFSSRDEIDEIMRGFALERVTRTELKSSDPIRVSWAIWAFKFV